LGRASIFTQISEISLAHGKGKSYFALTNAELLMLFRSAWKGPHPELWVRFRDSVGLLKLYANWTYPCECVCLRVCAPMHIYLSVFLEESPWLSSHCVNLVVSTVCSLNYVESLRIKGRRDRGAPFKSAGGSSGSGWE
jgi:hypothetical protein